MILPIQNTLRTRIQDVLAELYELKPADIPDINIQYPPKRTMGDLGITVAFELARSLRKAPRAIANEIVQSIGAIQGISHAEAAPNGYVNVFLDRTVFTRHVLGPHTKPCPRQTSKAIVEHTAINPNKAAHIGHLRNAALGDTLARVLRFLGNGVEVQNYIDDTGVQVADVIVGFQQLENATSAHVKTLSEQSRFDYYCWDLYARVTDWYDEDESRLQYRTDTLHALESGSNETAELGALIAHRIVNCHLATMARLNVDYDLLSWESDILRLHFWSRAFEILQAADAVYLETTGPQTGCWVMPITESSSGASTIPETTEDNNESGGPKSRTKVIVRSNGTVTYVGKDIAYQFWKFGILDKDFYYQRHAKQPSGRDCWSTTSTPNDHTNTADSAIAFGHADSVYNVIDTRQSYLQQLLKQALTAIEHANEADHSVHVSYEMVALSHATARTLGHSGDVDTSRPFVEVSGRKGLGVKADDLLDLLITAAKKEVIARHNDLSQDSPEAENISTAIAVAAVRYFMIKYSRGKLIAFDIDEAMSFEGESGPYVQYAIVRATNILKKLEAQQGCTEANILDEIQTLEDSALTQPSSDIWELLFESSRLDDIADQAARTLELSVLAKYAFSLAQSFNTFYHRCPVIAETDPAVRLWRAVAVIYCRRQLKQALDLMGCEAPTRM